MSLDPLERPSRKAPPDVTSRMVFWGGAVVVYGGGVLLSANDLRAYGPIVALVNFFGISGIVVGCIAIIVSHWFPNPRRKYSWRRR